MRAASEVGLVQLRSLGLAIRTTAHRQPGGPRHHPNSSALYLARRPLQPQHDVAAGRSGDSSAGVNSHGRGGSAHAAAHGGRDAHAGSDAQLCERHRQVLLIAVSAC